MAKKYYNEDVAQFNFVLFNNLKSSKKVTYSSYISFLYYKV
jgi:hypothetical protein